MSLRQGEAPPPFHQGCWGVAASSAGAMWEEALAPSEFGHPTFPPPQLRGNHPTYILLGFSQSPKFPPAGATDVRVDFGPWFV